MKSSYVISAVSLKHGVLSKLRILLKPAPYTVQILSRMRRFGKVLPQKIGRSPGQSRRTLVELFVNKGASTGSPGDKEIEVEEPTITKTDADSTMCRHCGWQTELEQPEEPQLQKPKARGRSKHNLINSKSYKNGPDLILSISGVKYGLFGKGRVRALLPRSTEQKGLKN